MSSPRYFYDIHCHAFNMSHPNLLAFIKRINLNRILLLNAVPVIGPLLSGILGSKIDTIMNLLSIMENDLGTYFFLMEQDAATLMTGNKLRIGSQEYDKIVLTPLIMDFGYKGTEKFPNIHFNQMPHKPIAEQVFDLFYGIKDYSEYSMKKIHSRFTYEKNSNENRLFEIYPFLGINTKNYTLTEVQDLLTKYFGNYTGKREDLFAKMGKFPGAVDAMDSNFFAGIKVYPPLGFDPWPAEDQERSKVECLYHFCIEKQIPITSHCSDGGFVTHDQAKEFTAPRKWKQVLDQPVFKDLRLNLAHFGRQGKKYLFFKNQEWLYDILELIETKNNVYADFSYRGAEKGYYDELHDLLASQKDARTLNKLKKRILFGSDFMINLLEMQSYTDYLKKYAEAGNNKPDFVDNKNLFCSENPERFLFRR